MKEILNIALVAHDSRKNELLDWVRFNADLLLKRSHRAWLGVTWSFRRMLCIRWSSNDVPSCLITHRR